MEYTKAIKHFVSNPDKPRKFGKYVASREALTYRTLVTETVRIREWGADAEKKVKLKQMRLRTAEAEGKITIIQMSDWDAKVQLLKEDTIAIRIPETSQVVGNSSILGLIGRRMAWGNEVMNRGETKVQRELSQHAVMVPFTVFAEAKLDIQKFKMIDKGPEESVTRVVEVGYDHKKHKPKLKEETVHFTGASLFRVENRYFLFDIDRREIKHKIFNAFLAELPRKCTSIADAYDSLIPDEVRKAMKRGLTVLRQGEWFFIPTTRKFTPDLNDAQQRRWQNSKYQRLELRAGDNRPNHATKGHAKSGHCSGVVSHQGREHAPLNLKDVWYKPIPNTATKSFTIVGDVD